jgi:hypothetical protein
LTALTALTATSRRWPGSPARASPLELNATYRNAVAAVEEAMNGANSEKSLERLNRFMTVRTWHDEPPESRT